MLTIYIGTNPNVPKQNKTDNIGKWWSEIKENNSPKKEIKENQTKAHQLSSCLWYKDMLEMFKCRNQILTCTKRKQTAEPWNTILFSNCNKLYTHHISNLLKFKTLIQKIMLPFTFHCFRKTEEETGHINNEQKLHMHKSDYGQIRHLYPSTLRCATSYQFKFLVASHCTWLVTPCNSCPNTNVTQLRPQQLQNVQNLHQLQLPTSFNKSTHILGS